MSGDKLPWSGKRTWEQKSEQAEVSETGQPEVSDPSADKQLPQVSDMQEAQQAASSQEVAPDETQEAGDTVVETETVETETREKFYQPEQNSEPATDDESESSEDSDES